MTLLDVTGLAQVFSSANDELPNNRTRYEVIVASATGGAVATDTGISLETRSIFSLSRYRIHTLVVAGGLGVFDALEDTKLVGWLRTQIPRAGRAASTCMGAFLTAETGLLKRKRVATHWRWCDELQLRHPELKVESEPIFIKDSRYASSAGVSAGIDLALSLVEDDHGRDVALAVARNLVLYLRRSGGQSQFSSLLRAQSTERSDQFNDLNVWITENLDADLRVEKLAERVGMSMRSFSRLYAASVGQTPGKAVETFRLERARQLLESTATPVKTVALRCGFGDYERMRRTFVRQLGTAPVEYRRRFGSM